MKSKAISDRMSRIFSGSTFQKGKQQESFIRIVPGFGAKLHQAFFESKPLTKEVPCSDCP